MTTKKRTRTELAIWVAAAILFAGLVSMYTAQAYFNVVLTKLPAPLQKPLPTLPTRMGRWKKWGRDQRLSPEIVQVLGTRQYLLRTYRKIGLPLTSLRSLVTLNLNFYSKGDATPHVPNVCWQGVGRKRVYDHIITIHHVRHADGKYSSVQMRFLSFATPSTHGGTLSLLTNSDHDNRLLNTAYMFQVNGRYAPNVQQVTQLFWKTDSKYSYHAKIEVDVVHRCAPKIAEAMIKNFIRASLAHIERRLPNWKKLNARPRAGIRLKITPPGRAARRRR